MTVSFFFFFFLAKTDSYANIAKQTSTSNCKYFLDTPWKNKINVEL